MISLIILKDFMCKSMDLSHILSLCEFRNVYIPRSFGKWVHSSFYGSAGDLGGGTLNTESSFFHLLGLSPPPLN